MNRMSITFMRAEHTHKTFKYPVLPVPLPYDLVELAIAPSVFFFHNNIINFFVATCTSFLAAAAATILTPISILQIKSFDHAITSRTKFWVILSSFDSFKPVCTIQTRKHNTIKQRENMRSHCTKARIISLNNQRTIREHVKKKENLRQCIDIRIHDIQPYLVAQRPFFSTTNTHFAYQRRTNADLTMSGVH